MIQVVSQMIPLMDFGFFSTRRIGFYHRGFIEQIIGEVLNTSSFKRRREQHVLFTPARFRGNLIHNGRKAHVQHAVGFVEN